MWFRKDKYIFPDDYSKFSGNLFEVCRLDNQSIRFTEVCNINKEQVCIRRKAVMKKLLANKSGDLFFEGECEQLGKLRIFELLMPEYEIDGVTYDLKRWFSKVTGKSLHMFRSELAKIEQTNIWSGCSPITEFTDVFTVMENGFSVQKVVKRKVNIIEVFFDRQFNFHVKTKDPETDNICDCQVGDLKLSTNGKEYEFFDWCRKIIKTEPYDFLPSE